MGDEKTNAGHRAGGAAKRPDVTDISRAKGDQRKTQAGQEPIRGIPPGKHDDEHQSDYGGGGTHGGANGREKGSSKSRR